VCLLECRTKPDTDCCFCRFEATNPGKIIDLSYNDVELSAYRKKINRYVDEGAKSSAIELLQDEEFLAHVDDEEYVKTAINAKARNEDEDRKKVVEFVGKTYFTLLSLSIYKKVDGSEEEKAKAYKSFHILSEYLQNKGMTGIIYPCTRDSKLRAKNLVLFEPSDAKPIVGTIKRYHFNG